MNFLKALRSLAAKARSNYVKTEEPTFHIFQTRSGDELSTHPVAQDDCERTPARAPEKIGPGRLMGFKRQRVELEQFATRETDAPDPTADLSTTS